MVQTAVKTHSMASHISSSWFCLSARLPPTASVTLTPGDNVQALIFSDCCSKIWGRKRMVMVSEAGSEVVIRFLG